MEEIKVVEMEDEMGGLGACAVICAVPCAGSSGILLAEVAALAIVATAPSPI